jgi:transcriptional regulator with XRE-family HTH domain
MRVKELLKERGMTAKDLAAKLGMTETGLGIAIGDKGNPPLKRLYEIAAALDVPITELFDKQVEGSFSCPNCGATLKITVHRVQ